MKITILDYRDRKKEIDVGELKNIRRMRIDVVSGDEILTVEHNDNTTERYDSSNDRTRHFYDGNYIIWNTDIEPEIDELENPEWLNRTHYSYLYEYGDISEADLSDWW